MVLAVAKAVEAAPGPSSVPRPATPRRRPPPMARRRASRSSSSCRRAASRPASCSRPWSPARGSSPSTATSTRRSHIVRELAEQDDHPVTLVNSVNPYRLDGQKTAAFEVCDDLAAAPGHLWLSRSATPATSPPTGRVPGVRRRRARDRPAADVGFPGRRCGAARPRSAGSTSRRRSPRPSASATPRRGTRRSRRGRDRRADRGSDRRRDPRGVPRPGPPRGRVLRAGVGGQRRRGPTDRPRTAARSATRTVVAVLTGHGLKDPDTAERQVAVIELAPTIGAVAVALGWT